jgi:hypothetical protein
MCYIHDIFQWYQTQRVKNFTIINNIFFFWGGGGSPPPIILLLGSITLLSGMTGISLHMQWPLTSQLHGSVSQREQLDFLLRIKLHALTPYIIYVCILRTSAKLQLVINTFPLQIRVTRRACEKTAQNVAQPTFCHNECTTLTVEK